MSQQAHAHSERLGTLPIRKLLVQLSLPATVGMIVNALYNLVDTIVVGRGVGAMAIGGLAIAFPIQMFIMAIAQMVGIGSASVISRALGKGDVEQADMTAGNSYTAIVILALITTGIGMTFLEPLLRIFGATDTLLPYAIEYMRVIFIGSVFFMFAVASNNLIRAEGNAIVAMISMFIGTGLNIILDPIFVFVLDMGIRGAALATIISQFLSFVFVLAYIYSGKSTLKVYPHHLLPRIPILKEIFTVGAPAFARQVGGSALAIVLNNSLGYYGGDLAITAFGIINRVMMFIFMPLFGVVQGFQPIAGYNYGAGKFNRVKEVIRLAMRYTTSYMIVGWLLIMIGSPYIVQVFTTNPEVIELGSSAMRLVLLAVPVIGVQIIGSSVFQAFGKAAPAMILTLLRQFILLIPMLLILPKIGGLGLIGIWIAYPLSDMISTAISLGFLRKEMSLLSVENAS